MTAASFGRVTTILALAACQGAVPTGATDTTPTVATGTPVDSTGTPSGTTTTTSTTTPPGEAVSTPVLGGGLTVLDIAHRVAATDPTGARVAIVDTANAALVRIVDLPEHSQPGRLQTGPDGTLWVALRRAGTIAGMDPDTGKVHTEIPACAAPRGLAADALRSSMWVACAGGELVEFDATGVRRTIVLDPDLRDVVVDTSAPDTLWVSRFRTAELLEIDASTGAVRTTRRPSALSLPSLRQELGVGVAYRVIPAAGGGAWMLHQRPAEHAVSTDGRSRGYGDGDRRCGSVVQASITGFGAADTGRIGDLIADVSLPVDLAHDSDGDLLVAVAGATPKTDFASSVVSYAPRTPSDPSAIDGCEAPTSLQEAGASVTTAVIRDDAGRLVTAGHHPFVLTVDGVEVTIGGDDATDAVAYRLFHQHAGAGIACASCHPEGTEDGHTWPFVPLGSRRTQSLGGGVMSTLPLHWAGEFASFDDLLADVHDGRMGGEALEGSEVTALSDWIDRLEPAAKVASGASADQIAVGKVLFEGVAACATCHAGDRLTDNTNHDVGTGGSFQTPSLRGVGNRLPLMHDGCATTLEQRFDPVCGGDAHGEVSGLTTEQRADLVAYLQQL